VRGITKGEERGRRDLSSSGAGKSRRRGGAANTSPVSSSTTPTEILQFHDDGVRLGKEGQKREIGLGAGVILISTNWGGALRSSNHLMGTTWEIVFLVR